ncbi:MAG: endonuclease/exonuclease/phosphatase family protein [Myxococcota bacterium]|nr:endonuclease/exonuclease/phosphatase family protein [Myxococcota bacterium]
MINLFILMEDVRLYTGDTEGIPMMSWNLNAPQKKEMDCVLPVIQQWEQVNPDGLIFLQEVSERNFQRIMDETSLLCMGASYHPIDSCRNRKKETCPGLAICAAKNWSFRRPHHKNFQDQRNYGYFQTELKPPGENEYFNALNIHLESLWRTRYELKTQNMTELLHQNTLRQHEQLGKIEKVLSILKDPVLLVGDFNSVSSMWLHRHLRTNLIDAHRFSGMGFGISAKRYSIPIRVDHLYIQAPMRWSGETRVLHQHTCSDHFPITSWFSLR